jgi:hypothetical protein
MRWPSRTPLQRFMEKVDVRSLNECWEWTGSRLKNGYGSFYLNRGEPAHRVSYEFFVGDIPEGQQIDHLCRNRGCVNPTHLEAVTPRTNVLRAFGVNRCKAGHARTPINIYVSPSGVHGCVPCRTEARRRWGERHRKAAS